MDIIQTGLYLLAAIALLASPGPAIAALIVVGRTQVWRSGFKFYCGLQIGLAAAAGLSVVGILAVLEAVPGAGITMAICSAIYLLYLAYKIATAPLLVEGGAGHDGTENSFRSAVYSPLAGVLLGLSNPKAYAAFLSLFASFILVEGDAGHDSLLKWGLCVGVCVVVDFMWLAIGVGLGKIRLSPFFERALNLAMAVGIVFATGFAVL